MSKLRVHCFAISLDGYGAGPSQSHKRRQAPPGVRITPRGFGKDWRYPITSGFRPKG
jgi:hypothetical protein